MERYSHVIFELENDLKQIAAVSGHPLNTANLSIRRCRAALVELKQMVLARGFPDKPSEIRFFKEIKPQVCSKLIYYQAVFGMESIRPGLDHESLKKYFQRQQKRILKYMKKNSGNVQYYRCGHRYLDEKYFLRYNEEIPLEVKDSLSLLDGDFFTWHDQTFSNIMANELLIEYIKNEMEKPGHPARDNFPKPHLSWTGNKIDLYEMIYSIYFAGSVNNGKVTIKNLVQAFEWLFDTELQRGIYKTQDELVKRADPVKYLSQLVDTLRRRIGHKLK